MRPALIIKLRRPAGNTSPVEVRPGSFTVEVDDLDPADVDALNIALQDIKTRFPDAQLHPSFPKFVKRLRHLDPSSAPFRDLALFFRIVLSQGTSLSRANQEAQALRHTPNLLQVIEFVAVGGDYRSTCDTSQGFLKSPESGGIHFSPQLELLPGGNGSNVQVCIVDIGAQLGHAHFDESDVDYVKPKPRNVYTEEHGTRVLGVLAPSSSKVPRGIVPGAKFRIASTARGDPQDETLDFLTERPTTETTVALNVIHAMDDALAYDYAERLIAGDVLLIEHETHDGLPVEYDPDVRTFFSDVASIDITVIEPAGNGTESANGGFYNLDAVDQVLDRDSEGESRAILVGAAVYDDSPTRPVVSNYGTRVDCHSWGVCVYTTTYTSDYVVGNTTTTDFGQTSAAAAIVAGVVALIQSLRKAVDGAGVAIDPLRIRDRLLEASGAETVQTSDPVGPQPDLMQILRDLSLLPDVFIRDSENDPGAAPSPSADIWSSPDIITRQTEPIDTPDSIFGDWSDLGLAEPVIAGARNYIYLRSQNRGPFDDDPTFEVSWAYPGTFLDPDGWHLIGGQRATVPGTTTANLNEAIHARTVVGPIVWDVPDDLSHPCLIAVANSVLDPAPALNSLSDDESYIDFIRRYNNIAHRNVITLTLSEDGIADDPLLPDTDIDPADDAAGAGGPESGAAFFCFNVTVPRIARRRTTRLRIVPRDAPREARMFIGFPREHSSAFLRSGVLPEMRPGDTEFLHEVMREESQEAVEIVARSLEKPVGDLRHREMIRSARWLVGPMADTAIQSVATPAGVAIPVIVGFHFAGDRNRSAFGFDVIQELRGQPVGRINLRVENRRHRRVG